MKLTKTLVKTLIAFGIAAPLAASAAAGFPKASFNDHPELYKPALIAGDVAQSAVGSSPSAGNRTTPPSQNGYGGQ